MNLDKITMGIAVVALIVAGLGMVGGDQPSSQNYADLERAIASGIVGGLVNSEPVNLGGANRFPNATSFSIGTSTTQYNLAVGDAGATTTIGLGRLCITAEDETGRVQHLTLAVSGNTVFASSTSACN